MGAMTKEAARWVIGPRSFRRLMPAIGWLGPLAFGRPTHAFAAQVDAILGADDGLADQLGTIDVPTLVVVGNQDILTPRGDSEELAELIPTAELVVISGAAHGLMVEHASTYNRILLDFLQRAEKAYQAQLAARPDGPSWRWSPLRRGGVADNGRDDRLADGVDGRWAGPTKRRNSENDSAGDSHSERSITLAYGTCHPSTRRA